MIYLKGFTELGISVNDDIFNGKFLFIQQHFFV